MTATTTQIDANVVKTLREKTGAGMMDCKKALVEAKGDQAEAEVILRKKGITVAGKKAGRVANEGRIASYIHHGSKLDQLAEALVASHKVRLAVHFQQHAKLAAVVNVAGDAAFLGGAQGFLPGDGDAFLAKDLLGFGEIAAGLLQRLFAVHHAGAGLFAKGFDEFGVDLYCASSHGGIIAC